MLPPQRRNSDSLLINRHEPSKNLELVCVSLLGINETLKSSGPSKERIFIPSCSMSVMVRERGRGRMRALDKTGLDEKRRTASYLPVGSVFITSFIVYLRMSLVNSPFWEQVGPGFPQVISCVGLVS